MPGKAKIIERLTVIGGGNMASAIIAGLAKLSEPPAITIAEPDPGKRAAFAAAGHTAIADNRAAIADADVVLLAIKPQALPAVAEDLASAWSSKRVLVSILAGMPTVKFEAILASTCHAPRVVRAMPNTPMAIGKGMVGICPGANAGIADLIIAEALFAPCAKILRVDESRMDAITAISGSGPAYFFRFAEALLAGAQALGFTREEAALLIGTTGAGSWEYLVQSGFDAAALRTQVTSPGGTTAAALSVIDAAGFDDLWTRAVQAAESRGQELGAGSK